MNNYGQIGHPSGLKFESLRKDIIERLRSLDELYWGKREYNKEIEDISKEILKLKVKI